MEMTEREKQQQVKDQVIRKVKELLGEHFEAYVLMAEAEDPDDPDKQTISRLHWSGGFHTAWGLTSRAILRFQEISSGKREDDEDE
jgi:hypothetical protein